MRALDNTNLSGAAAVDEAVRACSTFSSASEWINSFVTKAREYYSDSNKASIYGFLQDVCNIDLTNEDTGAITGSDAKATSTQQTVDTIVPISGTAVYPTSSTSIFDGLTVHWPTSVKTETEKLMIQGLNSWWIKGALDLIKKSYGIDFTETGTTVHDINVKLCYGDDTKISGSTSDYFLAQVRYYYSDGDKGISQTMELHINMDAYAALSSTDTHGKTSTGGVDPALDRLLAHELTHAVMVANDNYFYRLPLFITEGLAELTSGTDDRLASYMDIFTSMETSVDIPGLLASALTLNKTGYTGIYPYLAGYAALRYLAAYQSDLSPSVYASTSTITYNTDQTSLKVLSGYNGKLWLGSTSGTSYAPTVTTLDASAATNDLTLIGNSNSNTIIAGSGTNAIWGGSSANDTIECGTGNDTIWYGINDGSDTIKNFKSGKDTVYVYNGSISDILTSGSDVILDVGTSSSDKLLIKDGVNRQLTMNIGGNVHQVICTRRDQDSTVTWSSGIDFYDASDSYTNTLAVTGNSGAVVRLDNTSAQTYYGFTRIDASGSSGADTLVGSSSADIISTGYGNSAVWGGSGGNDLFKLGNGPDTVWYGINDGDDAVENFTSGQDTLYLYNGCVKDIVTSGSDVILNVGDSTHTTGSLTIRDGTNRQLAMNIMGTVHQVYCAQQDQANTVTWSSGIDFYYASGSYTDTLAVTGSSDSIVRLDNTSSQTFYGFRAINAAASSGADILVGSSSADLIYTGTGSSQTWGGIDGDDTFQLGSGTDRVWYGLNDGNDTIVNGTASDSVFFYDIINISKIAFSLQGTTLKGTTASGSSFYIQNWSASGLNTFETSDNMKYSLSLVNDDLHIVDKV